VYGTLGDVLIKQGKYAEARDAYTGTLKLDPKNVLADRGLVMVLAREGKCADAKTRLGEVTEKYRGDAAAGEVLEKIRGRVAEVCDAPAVGPGKGPKPTTKPPKKK